MEGTGPDFILLEQQKTTKTRITGQLLNEQGRTQLPLPLLYKHTGCKIKPDRNC